MAEEKKNRKIECTADKHQNHLCFLMGEGWHLTQKQKYKDMVQDAQYRCEYCDRTAQKAENLCAPIEL